MYLRNQETVSLSNTESHYNEKPDDKTIVYIINTLYISTDIQKQDMKKHFAHNN